MRTIPSHLGIANGLKSLRSNFSMLETNSDTYESMRVISSCLVTLRNHGIITYCVNELITEKTTSAKFSLLDIQANECTVSSYNYKLHEYSMTVTAYIPALLIGCCGCMKLVVLLIMT